VGTVSHAPSLLERSVYKTLGYFAYFQYPLTSFEIWKWLLEPEQPVTLAQIEDALATSSWLRSRVRMYNGFYALGDVHLAYRERHQRFVDATRKYRKIRRWAQVIGRLPWVEGIAVCNSLAWFNTTTNSDIDVFIVAKPGRVWSVRLLATLPLIIFRQRPGERQRDPICLSFFSTPEKFQFEDLKISSTDPYLAYWCQSLVPILDHGDWTQVFMDKNTWLKAVLPQAKCVNPAVRFRTRLRWRIPWLPLSEKLAKQLQMDKFPQTIKAMMNRDSRVIVTDDMLKFHDQDSRAQIVSALAKRMLGI
jgi:hypothetical protein